MYQKVDTNLNFVDREKQVEKFWKENHIFEKSMEDRKDDPTYMFYDGPPTANGKPHIGHVLTRVIKDHLYGLPYSFQKYGSLSRTSLLVFHDLQNSDSYLPSGTQLVPPFIVKK